MTESCVVLSPADEFTLAGHVAQSTWPGVLGDALADVLAQHNAAAAAQASLGHTVDVSALDGLLRLPRAVLAHAVAQLQHTSGREWLVCQETQGVLRRERTRSDAVAWCLRHAQATRVKARSSVGAGTYLYTVTGDGCDAATYFVARAAVAWLGGYDATQAPLYPWPGEQDLRRHDSRLADASAEYSSLRRTSATAPPQEIAQAAWVDLQHRDDVGGQHVDGFCRACAEAALVAQRLFPLAPALDDTTVRNAAPVSSPQHASGALMTPVEKRGGTCPPGEEATS